MKYRILAVLMIIVLLTPTAYAAQINLVGQEIELGEYEQDGNSQNGSEPIEWIILSVDETNGTALAVSKYILDCQLYNKMKENTVWKNSSIHKWLNTSFYDTAFSSDEKQAIVPTKVSNSVDQVFLLNASQIQQMLSTDLCYATAYAKQQGVFVSNDTGTSSWWVQTSKTSTYGVFVGAHGAIYEKRNKVTAKDNGVRPAVTLSLSYLLDDTPGATLSDMQVNDRITIDKWGTLKATSLQVLDKLGMFDQGITGTRNEDFLNCFDSKSEAQIIVLKMDIINISDVAQDYSENVEVTVQLGSVYQFRGWCRQFNYSNGVSMKYYVNEEDAGRQNKNYVIHPNDNFQIQPGQTGHYCFGCTVTNAAMEMNDPMKMTITIDGHEIVFYIRK